MIVESIMPDKIEVLIVDDHQKLRRGIIALLAHAEDIRIVGEASTGAEAIALVKRNPPHVVLIDLQMPEVDGIEATIAIKNNWPQVKV
ncbi:MAG: DNA-binding response regulator, partial [Chloroflexi bacterium]